MLILGILDIIAAGLLLTAIYDLSLPNIVIFIFAGYLIIKGLAFIRDIGSLLDILVGIFLILTIYLSVPVPLLIIFALLLGLKGILSLFAGGVKF